MASQACSQKLQLGGSFVQNCGPFEQNSGTFNNFVVFSNKIVDIFDKFVAFSSKIVDLFGKIVDLLFERVVLQRLENPPGYELASSYMGHIWLATFRLVSIVKGILNNI